jgi:serine/threonine protein kinase
MRAGETIGGRYELAEKLGSGSFGVVWRAEETFTFTDDRTQTSRTELISDVAIKVFTARVEVLELQILATCDHPNVLRYRAIVEHEDAAGREYVCLVTELAEGGDVGEMLRGFRKGLPPAQVERILLPMAEALAYLHSREHPVVHRDIKPPNVLVVGATYKLGDVGTAKALEGGGTDTSKDQGTIAYTAPERFDGKILPAADIYSLGVSAYELLTGRLPFMGTPLELMKHHSETSPQIPRDLPAPWQELLRYCLAKDPGERWSAEQVVWFLRDRPAEEERKRLEAAAREAVGYKRERDRLTVELAQTRQKTVKDFEDLHDVLHQAQLKADTDQQERKRLEQETQRLTSELEEARNRSVPPQLTPTVDFSQLRHPKQEAAPPRRRWLAPVVSAAVALLVGVPVGTMFTGNAGDEQEPPVPMTSLVNGQNTSSAADPALAPPDSEPDPGPPPLNPWVRIEAPSSTLPLGLPGWLTSPEAKGFRASRGIMSSDQAYEIQQHEVTRFELRPWLAQQSVSGLGLSWLARPGREDRLPATNIPWQIAQSYCKSLGGDLPTEEQWEYGARGPQLRNYPWGNQEIDTKRTHVFRPGKALSEVMTNDQDRTPGEPSVVIHDLLGNAQEWTRSLWRESEPGQDESWVQLGGKTYRAVRGLPPSSPPPEAMPVVGAAFRRILCATGDCPQRAEEARETVGFRCVRE